MKTLLCSFLALLVGTGCSSPTVQRLQRSQGLFDFLAGNPGETSIPIETIAGGAGRIEAAYVRAYRRGTYVSGYVGGASLGGPSGGAHVDVIVVDAQHRPIEAKAVDYLPHSIPHGVHGGFAHSTFCVRLDLPPPTGATVRVVFHDKAKRRCAFATQSHAY